MELLTSPKAIYLLEADLTILHEESQEWLNDISFWRDEIAFFYTLMIKKVDKDYGLVNKSELAHIQDEILSLSGREFSDLETIINQHENYLSSLLANNLLKDEQVFRDKHRLIASLVNAFALRMRMLKKRIFTLVEKRHA